MKGVFSASLLALVLVASALPAADEESAFEKTTFTFKQVDGLPLKVDVHRYSDDELRPVIVWLHGGALIMGSRTGVPTQILDLAKRERFVVVSLDYRLAPQVKLPEIIADVRDGLTWVRESGREQFSADTSRMLVAGASAGGYLALMSGIVIDPPPKAIVSYWGFGDIDGDWTTKPDEDYRKGKLIEKEMAWAGIDDQVLTQTDKKSVAARSVLFLYLKQNGLWLDALTGLDPVKDRDQLTPFCPVRNVSPSFPPTLFLHGTADRDVPVEQSTAMVAELEKHGVAHELIKVEGGGHSLWGGDRKKIDQAFRRSMEYIREQLTS